MCIRDSSITRAVRRLVENVWKHQFKYQEAWPVRILWSSYKLRAQVKYHLERGKGNSLRVVESVFEYWYGYSSHSTVSIVFSRDYFFPSLHPRFSFIFSMTTFFLRRNFINYFISLVICYHLSLISYPKRGEVNILGKGLRFALKSSISYSQSTTRVFSETL